MPFKIIFFINQENYLMKVKRKSFIQKMLTLKFKGLSAMLLLKIPLLNR
jgi:hypothetical protein